MWRGVLAMGLVMALATLLTIDIFLPGGLVEGSHDIDRARTAGFTALVFKSSPLWVFYESDVKQ